MAHKIFFIVLSIFILPIFGQQYYPLEYEPIVNAILAADPSFYRFPTMVRLAFHASGTYDASLNK